MLAVWRAAKKGRFGLDIRVYAEPLEVVGNGDETDLGGCLFKAAELWSGFAPPASHMKCTFSDSACSIFRDE